MPDNFNHQWRASGWERVNLSILFLNLSSPRPAKPSPLLFYSVSCQTILLINGEPLGGKGLIYIMYFLKLVSKVISRKCFKLLKPQLQKEIKL